MGMGERLCSGTGSLMLGFFHNPLCSLNRDPLATVSKEVYCYPDRNTRLRIANDFSDQTIC